MKHLSNAIEVIKNCCTRREPLEENKYNQLMHLLPLHEQFEKREQLGNFEKEIEDEGNKKKNFELLNTKRTGSDSNNVYDLNDEEKIKDILKKEAYISNKDPQEEKTDNNKLLNGDLNKKHVEHSFGITFAQKNHINIHSDINKVKRKKSTNIYCAYGKLHDMNYNYKHFNLKQIEIIPKYEKKENLAQSFSIVCISGNQHEVPFLQNNIKKEYEMGTKTHLWKNSLNLILNTNSDNVGKCEKNQKKNDSNNSSTYGYKKKESFNDAYYFNNYEQFFIVKAYGFKIIGLISGIGKNNITVCDATTFHLLKNVLTNMKKVYNNRKFQKWTCEKIEYILLSSVTETNHFLKENVAESFHSGLCLCISAYSQKYNILTILNIGNIQTVLAKEVEEKESGNERIGTSEDDISYEVVVLTKNHDILNKEEKKRIESFVPANKRYWGKNVCNIRNNTWEHINDRNGKVKHMECNENPNFNDNKQYTNQIKTLNVTKAIGLFHFTNCGLLNIPDIVDVKLKKNTKGFLVLFSHSISKVYNTNKLIQFLFKQSNQQDSLFQMSKKLIYNVQSIYMSTKNKNIKDMTIIIMPLVD